MNFIPFTTVAQQPTEAAAKVGGVSSFDDGSVFSMAQLINSTTLLLLKMYHN